MRILFVFTGGTIGSTLSGDIISTDEGKSYRIIEAYRERFGIDFEYDMLEPYTALSENNILAILLFSLFIVCCHYTRKCFTL